MRFVIVFALLLVGSSNLLAGGYDLPTDIIIESDCDIEPTAEAEPITVVFVP